MQVFFFLDDMIGTREIHSEEAVYMYVIEGDENESIGFAS